MKNNTQIKALLPDAQKAELGILTDIDAFCRKNKLKYTLGFGTLLGAVRHKGFIPWDDDIDIWMPIEDYNHFISKWSDNPLPGYILLNTDENVEFTQNFTKIRKDNTTFLQEYDIGKSYHKGIFIDIFPFYRASSNLFKYSLQKFYSLLMMLFHRKFSPPTETGMKKIISKFILCIIPKKQYEYCRKKCTEKIIQLADNNGPYFCPVTFSDVSKLYPADMFERFEQVDFEHYKFLITSKYRECLTIRTTKNH